MNQQKEITLGKSTVKEKIFYALGDIGINFVWTFTGAFLILYYTDSVGISTMFIGTMMLFTRIFDGISDIIMGLVIEKTRTRWGKARPWVLFGSIPLCLGLVAVFNVPSGLSEGGKNIYVFLTYIFLTVICYTIVYLSYHAMLSRFSLDQQDRTVVTVVRTIFISIFGFVLAMVTPILLKLFGGDHSQRAWTIISTIYAILALFFLMVCFFVVKERIPTENADSDTTKKVPLRQTLHTVLTNKYFYIATFSCMAFYVSQGVGGGGIYYVRDVMGDASYLGLFGLASVIPFLVVTPFTALMFKKFGKRKSIVVGMFLSICSCIAQYTNPTDLSFVLFCMVVRSIGYVPFGTAQFTLPGDIIDYDDWKTGTRTEGLTTSIISFGMKVGTGIGSALVGWLLAVGQYDGSATMQSQSAINAMIGINVGIPLVCYVIIFAVMLFWNIDKYRSEINIYLATKRKMNIDG